MGRQPRVCEVEGCDILLPPKRLHWSRFCFLHMRMRLSAKGEDPEKRKVILNRYRKKRYKERRAKNLCMEFKCDRMTGGKVYCPLHREERNRRRRDERWRQRGK